MVHVVNILHIHVHKIEMDDAINFTNAAEHFWTGCNWMQPPHPLISLKNYSGAGLHAVDYI